MIEIKEKDRCCGCEACMVICPVHCIEMVYDEEGFRYPKVDFDKCIRCGKCKGVCPIINETNITNSEKIVCYAAYNVNEVVRLQSSSGGIFYLLAKRIIEEGGVVYGVGFSDGFDVVHLRVENIEDVMRVLGSKYVQSCKGDSYEYVKKDLEAGKKVLFSGTPCEVQALQSYLGRAYEELVTLDVLCHGVPSGLLWNQYRSEKKKDYKSEIEKINFRGKRRGWRDFSLDIEFKSGKVYEKSHNRDNYMLMFLGNLTLRPSCYACSFKNIDRDSDISLGDWWSCDDEMDDDRGVSVIFLRTQKGENLFHSIMGNVKYKEIKDIDLAVSPMAESRCSPKEHPKKEEYLRLWKKGKKTKVLARLVKRSMVQRVCNRLELVVERCFVNRG